MSSSVLHTIPLSRKARPEDYKVYRAGLEWDLADPIVIESRDDLKSEHRWRDRLEPFHHQVTNLITFCRRLPVTLLADDVGLGKTISAGLIISELIARARVSKILIVCPKLLRQQWEEELFSKFDLPAEIVTGQEFRDIDPEGPSAVITTYETAREHLESIPQYRYQMLILDEAHKLRNLHGTPNTPQVAQVFQKALEERRFRYVLMLTATPIQNRLWDLYSLVDLLSVSRGHQNPFGSKDVFARKFIADGRNQARQLNLNSADEFRSIVYSYMSRIRRGDANLFFPDRVVHMHKIAPTKEELQIISTVAEPIQSLNRLSQISILQALTSSPEALNAQLKNMARNGTAPLELAKRVDAIVANMPASAKLQGLGDLIDRLKLENRDRWRLVIFTERLETQTAIQRFLEKQGFKVGVINSATGDRNQETIRRFRKDPPDYRIIISTRAGSEGVNLQVANVLVNYDLPWNPMIVEQRIGRIQRLASKHAKVVIFNITLSGTFEEYIVGRLMEKLQMASHAIGDIESLLSSAGLNDDNFEETLRKLVLAALAGKNIEAATKLALDSITEAKDLLKQEQENINYVLGASNGQTYAGPRAPKLPGVDRSMDSRQFTLAALESLGDQLTQAPSGEYLLLENGARKVIRFDENTVRNRNSIPFAPGTPAFLQLVGRITSSGIHDVEDLDQNPDSDVQKIAREWSSSFGGVFDNLDIKDTVRCFEGTALIRVRALVAHDSYERLVEAPCAPSQHFASFGRAGMAALPPTVESPSDFALNLEMLANAARTDAAIAEFSRFYLERRTLETQAAGEDERKRKKLEDEFTPRFEITLAALDGKLYRQVKTSVKYRLEGFEYNSDLTLLPHKNELVDSPPFLRCEKSGASAPKDCLGKCQISGKLVLKHLLMRSETSSRLALPEYIVQCGLSGQRVLQDEVEVSAISGRLVASSLLRASKISGVRAEPEYFGRCEFTNADVLLTELETSEISGKRYRSDEQTHSVISGKTGHQKEFIRCHETRQPLLRAEAEKCEVSGNFVRPGILESCAVTGKRVLPSELYRCAATGKRALKSFFVKSSVSEANLLEQVAVRSAAGKYCSDAETKACIWSGQTFHPEDLRICEWTGLSIHYTFSTSDRPYHLQPLAHLLNGVLRTSDEPEIWDVIQAKVALLISNNRCRIEAAILSPNRRHLLVCLEIKTYWGLRTHQAGFLFNADNQSIVGRLVEGRRTSRGWIAA